MDLQALMTVIQNLGAMGILALMVWKSPQILTVVQNLIQKSVDNVRETQREALTAFKGETEKMMTIFSERFESIEKTLTVSLDHQTQLIEKVGLLAERVGALERANFK
jgi:hypothetical protein